MIAFFDKGLYPLLAELFRTTTEGAALALFFGCVLLAGVIGYFLGGINSAILISKLFYRDDIRRHGSGNAGTTNMLRTYGVGAAIGTLLGDILKTVLSILIAYTLTGTGWDSGFAVGLASMGAYVAALGCVMGHVFPVYYGFRGGKGVLCASTAIAMLSPYVFLFLLLIFVVTVAITKYVSLGSCLAAAVYPLFLNGLCVGIVGAYPLGHATVISILLAVLILYLHKDNIKRLRAGEEHRISFRKKEDKHD